MKPIPVIATAALAALTATGAIAATSHPTVKAAGNAKLGHAIVIEAKKGMSLYYLVGDKEGRLCKTQCIGFWPPLTVKSLHTKVVKGKGINGRLTVFRRSDGTFQVALRGKALYRFAGDSAKGQANGEGIQSFGGTWHAMPALGY